MKRHNQRRKVMRLQALHVFSSLCARDGLRAIPVNTPIIGQFANGARREFWLDPTKGWRIRRMSA